MATFRRSVAAEKAAALTVALAGAGAGSVIDVRRDRQASTELCGARFKEEPLHFPLPLKCPRAVYFPAAAASWPQDARTVPACALHGRGPAPADDEPLPGWVLAAMQPPLASTKKRALLPQGAAGDEALAAAAAAAAADDEGEGDVLADFEAQDEQELAELRADPAQDEYADWDELGREMGFENGNKRRKRKRRKTSPLPE